MAVAGIHSDRIFILIMPGGLDQVLGDIEEVCCQDQILDLLGFLVGHLVQVDIRFHLPAHQATGPLKIDLGHVDLLTGLPGLRRSSGRVPGPAASTSLAWWNHLCGPCDW